MTQQHEIDFRSHHDRVPDSIMITVRSSFAASKLAKTFPMLFMMCNSLTMHFDIVVSAWMSLPILQIDALYVLDFSGSRVQSYLIADVGRSGCFPAVAIPVLLDPENLSLSTIQV